MRKLDRVMGFPESFIVEKVGLLYIVKHWVLLSVIMAKVLSTLSFMIVEDETSCTF